MKIIFLRKDMAPLLGAFDPGILIKIYFEITIQNRISSPDSAPDRGEKIA